MSAPPPNPAENPDVPPAPDSAPDGEEITDPPAAGEPLPPPIWDLPPDGPDGADGADGADPLPPPTEPAGPADVPGAAGPEELTWAAELSRRPSFGQAVVMISGVLLFVWGFLPWYSDAGGSANAWSTVTVPGLVLTATWVPLLSLAIVIFMAIKVFADGFPDRILGFSWAQLAMAAGLFDVLITLGYLVANRRLGNLGTLDLGAGLILSFITGLVMLAGAVTDHLGMGGGEIFTRLRPPQGNAPRDRE